MTLQIYPLKKLLIERKFIEEESALPIAAILCSSYEISLEKLDWIERKLLLNFEDISNPKNGRAFTVSQANEVRRFVDALSSSLERLYVCCDGGVSRSSAIAAAIYRYIGYDEMIIWKNPYYHPNTLVYELMCRAFDLKNSKWRTTYLHRINERVFSDTIKASRRRNK